MSSDQIAFSFCPSSVCTRPSVKYTSGNPGPSGRERIIRRMPWQDFQRRRSIPTFVWQLRLLHLLKMRTATHSILKNGMQTNGVHLRCQCQRKHGQSKAHAESDVVKESDPFMAIISRKSHSRKITATGKWGRDNVFLHRPASAKAIGGFGCEQQDELLNNCSRRRFCPKSTGR